MPSADSAESYDAIVIGTGQAGKPLARALGQAGWRTAIVERGHVGGTCINVGCTPTKTMVASARVAYLARRAADYGVRLGTVQVDLEKVVRRKQAIVERFRSGSHASLEKTANVDLIAGDAAFEAPQRIEVRSKGQDPRHLRSEHIFINTGTRPAKPAIAGLEEIPFLDNASIMELETLPEHLVVLGGGYIGLEFAQMFGRFGSRVTIVHRGKRLLSREDTDISDEVACILREDGINVMLGTSTHRVERAADGLIRLEVDQDGRKQTVSGSHLLVATGRIPNTDKLGLEMARVQTDVRGYIQVNERLETSTSGIYALGDVNGGPSFTHVAYDDFRIVRTNLLENGNASTRDRLTPYTVYIDPQLGRVGLTEAEASARGIPHRVAKLPMAHVARAIETDETRGFMKALVDTGDGKILGCAILGIEGGEVMSVLQTAMMGGLPYTALQNGVFAHPTLAESLNNLFMGLDS
ncbi:MAG: mercuric reductase [Acidobacteria bacterium]|nr:mercuric reductase [Acidobacteriota bacterium]